jgi:uncharacterized protein YbjT (DUF2867 family)
MTVLVTGATGNVGSAVVRELSRRGVPVRAFVRDPLATLAETVEIAIGDFEDPASIRAALLGVDRVFLSSGDGPRKVVHEAAVIDAAVDAELIVKASTLAAQVGSPLAPLHWNGVSEEHLRRSGRPWVILASGFYMTNVLAVAEPVRTQAVLPAPAGDGRIAMIDPRDVGAVAAAVLAGSGHEGHTYRLTGPAAISYPEVAAAIAAATGTDVRYVDVPPDVARAGLVESGMPGWLVDHLDRIFGLIRAGAFDETTDSVRVLTGREPRTFEEFARDHADAFRPAMTTGRPGVSPAAH